MPMYDDPLHTAHLTSDEKGAYVMRFVLAAGNDNIDAHNATFDEMFLRTRGCQYCLCDLYASQAMFLAQVCKAIDRSTGGSVVSEAVAPTLNALLDKSQAQ